MFSGNLLDIVLPTDEEELANLLLLHSYDWEPVLAFLDSVSKSRGLLLRANRVAQIIHEAYAEEV